MKNEQIIYIGKPIPFKNGDSKTEAHFYRNIIRLVDDILENSDFIEVSGNGKILEQKSEIGLEDTTAS